jgi:hypothetical protein
VGAPGKLFDGSRRKIYCSSNRLRAQAEMVSLLLLPPIEMSANDRRALTMNEASALIENWSNAYVTCE